MTHPVHIWHATGGSTCAELRRLADEARSVKHTGRTEGSLEPDETAGLDYRVLTGTHAPEWLWRVYSILHIEAVTRTGLAVRRIKQRDHDADVAVNLNILAPGQRYEKHRDSCAWTLIIFATHAHTGGRFFLCHPDTDEPLASFDPTLGLGILFDGHTIAHYTEPLQGATERVALILQYPDPSAIPAPRRHRDYLYGKQEA